MTDQETTVSSCGRPKEERMSPSAGSIMSTPMAVLTVRAAMSAMSSRSLTRDLKTSPVFGDTYLRLVSKVSSEEFQQLFSGACQHCLLSAHGDWPLHQEGMGNKHFHDFLGGVDIVFG